ncbi:glycosyltransferase [Rhizobium leguminosarum]|uniref:Glycosyltransferase family 2 protein n=1 Tax=Rhizobium leguminosarum TaxID=384 RepID=A0ABD7PUW6_RHILE|nr:glycosyltransferase [Rhizobium leguminosarum]TAV75020.1 glycosyltransferase family 2 protein [Rhizobium leguminosarum]TAV79620.1 glycosyltransferase family 2 protein [Rhizobium leguminosarum]TAW30955.1 glycosyltransferase family 2 protein [Rhizobium leguminosarum]TAW44682.1 glycosyltransferase family 2 protein [Rhizobium leguminosarum]TAZ31351.1 glycosyltransferase family 2 protein [Rhizobium leguminosarum]
MSKVKVTVLFSTYNGAKTLPRMLDALCACTLSKDEWKIVAVDNNSKDDTSQVLKSYQDRLPLEVYFEPKQGKQHALTQGFRHLEGELVILTDDDVIPEPDWIAQFLDLADEQPQFDIFGGLILPAWEEKPQPWLLEHGHLGILYALNDDLKEGPISAALISGPNSAFRRSILGTGYIVHDGLGPDATVAQFPMGEDTAFALRLEKNGARAFHSQRPKVQHIVRKGYVEEGWVLRRGERYGMGLVIIRPNLFNSKAKIFGLPIGSALRWLLMAPVSFILKGFPQSGARFKLLWAQSVRQGILRQFIKQRFATGNAAYAQLGVGK